MAVLTVIAGPNGSGKTTLSRKLLSGAPATHINPDDISKQIADATGRSQKDADALAYGQSKQRAEQFRSAGQSYSYETVMSHPSRVEDMEAAHREGYHVRLIYVYLHDVNENINRVTKRFMAGGHNIPPLKIRSRFINSLALLPRAVRATDRAIVMSNDGKDDPAQLRLISADGVFQIHRDLAALISKVAKADGLSWDTLGFHLGMQAGDWTQFAIDRSHLSDNELQLARQRNDLLASFNSFM